MEQLNSIATATELLARGTRKRSRCHGPRNPFARVCEPLCVARCFPTRCRTRASPNLKCNLSSTGLVPIVSPAAHCRFDIPDRIFIHLLLSFCLYPFAISPLCYGKSRRNRIGSGAESGPNRFPSWISIDIAYPVCKNLYKIRDRFEIERTLKSFFSLFIFRLYAIFDTRIISIYYYLEKLQGKCFFTNN